MNDQQFDDLKQFITTTVSQTEANLDSKITNLDGRIANLDGKISNLDGKIAHLDGKMANLDDKIELLRQEMQEGFAGVGEAVENILTQIDEFEVSTDRRLKKLEKQSA